MNTSGRIHFIGDSHASFFSGNNFIQPCWPERSSDLIPRFSSYRLGAATAYSLGNPLSSTGSYHLLNQVLEHLGNTHDPVIMVFGEIDCRAHLLRLSKEKGISPEILVDKQNIWFLLVLSESMFKTDS